MQKFQSVFISGVGHHLPGTAIDNENLDKYIGVINKQSNQIKRRILSENGIQSRYYGINPEGQTQISLVEMAAKASMVALEKSGVSLADVDMITTGTVGGDLAVPGLANLLQGELKAHPLETISVNGICASGMAALKVAAESLELGENKNAIVAAAEFPSRLFKKTRFEKIKGDIDFNSHFLRWMLSDGAGSIVLTRERGTGSVNLKLNWMHAKSFSGDYPTCMSIGASPDYKKSYLDYASFHEAEEEGAFFLRQDIRLLPNLFEVGFTEYLKLVKDNHVVPTQIDHFLCHYSSEKFSTVIENLMLKSDVFIPKEKWYSNLKKSGNTGSASIFIMLSEFLQDREVKAGDKILLFVPESGRFTVCFAELEVVVGEDDQKNQMDMPAADILRERFTDLFLGLTDVWRDYRSSVMRTPLVNKIMSKRITSDDYKSWMEIWIPQVKQGALWMRKAIEHAPFSADIVKSLINEHANEEQFDFKILFNDYKKMGGTRELDELQRSPAGEALNSYMFSQAEKDPLSLLGAIFIIEGTGQKIIPSLLPYLKDQLGSGFEAFKFLEYHGENDQRHLERWVKAVEFALSVDADLGVRLIETAKRVSKLYTMQWEDALKKW